jgi:ArsR family transcriptional regulator
MVMVNVLTPKGRTLQQRAARRAAPVDATGLEVPEAAIEELLSIFKLVADETRLRILYFLSQRAELHVRAFCELLGQSQPAVSHHLATLKQAGLIDRRREGKHNYYALRTGRLTELLDKFFERLPADQKGLRIEDYTLTRA